MTSIPTHGHYADEELGLFDEVKSLYDKVLADLARRGAHDDANLPTENVIAIVGPRGAGKSTVMAALHEALTKEAAESSRSARSERSVTSRTAVLEVIDCSAVADELPPGAVVIDRLRACLADLAQRDATHGKKDARKRVLEELRAIAQVQATMSSHFHMLSAELASSPDDYGETIVASVAQRVALHARLKRTLDEMTTAFEIDHVVAFLEDFDLVSGMLVRRWLQALLDEFRQTRLVVVVTADLHRLEHLGLDAGREFDQRTGHAIVAKVIPNFRQFHLAEWHRNARMAYVPFDAPAGSESLEKLLDRKLKQKHFHPTYKALLPWYPRGLRSLWYTVRDWEARDDDARRISAALAYARGEPLLARRLREDPPERILHELAVDLEPAESRDPSRSPAVRRQSLRAEVTPEVWRATLDAASATVGDDLRGMAAFVLDARELDGLPHHGQSLSVQVHEHDPLRKDLLRYAPLRDARSSEQPLWIEALTDRAWRDEPYLRSAHLVTWGAFRPRVARAAFRVRLEREMLAKEFHTARTPMREVMAWLAWATPKEEAAVGDRVTLEVGWWPLFQVLRGAAPAWDSELLAHLHVGVDQLDTAPTQTPTATYDCLPARLRAMVPFVDALERCPWPAYAHLGHSWRLTLWLGLAAALVRAAYYDAMVRVGLAAWHGPERTEAESLAWREKYLAHARFGEQLRRRDPILGRALVEGRYETSVEALQRELSAFFREVTPLRDGHDPEHALCVAARAFEASAPYVYVKKLHGA